MGLSSIFPGKTSVHAIEPLPPTTSSANSLYIDFDTLTSNHCKTSEDNYKAILGANPDSARKAALDQMIVDMRGKIIADAEAHKATPVSLFANREPRPKRRQLADGGTAADTDGLDDEHL